MEFMKYCRVWAIVLLFPFAKANGQTVYYPSDASTILKHTATDMAQLLQSAIPGSSVTTQAYNTLPSTGIILQYDSSITDNLACIAIGNGTTHLLLKAGEDNGLIFGIYQYLRDLGFSFYQPGELWNIIPNLHTPFRSISKTYNGRFKYQSWFISGGHRLWIMDSNTSYNWNGSYIGENGHEWSLFMRRNGMLGKHRFTGHRADIFTAEYTTTLQNNPCYVASHSGSRLATASSVPDIFSSGAKFLWADAIEKKYSVNRATIFTYPLAYKDQVRSFRYNNGNIGIEVPDGARWGFGDDSMNCNNLPYPNFSNQSAILANYTSQLIRSRQPGKRTQMYAYYTHADIPSQQLDSFVDVQVPTVYQAETSVKNLFNRWYKKHSAVSEYHYLNIPGWTAETPGFTWKTYQQSAQRMKDNNGQGIVIEASPAKFSSIPLLRANNNNLLYNTSHESELKKFCDDMFGQATVAVYDLLLFLGNDQEFLGLKKDNKYRLPLLIDKLKVANLAAGNESAKVKQRLLELKAYVHYIVLYYEYLLDEKLSESSKKTKAGNICLYLAKCNKLRIVNSYYLINKMVSDRRTDTVFASRYNSQTGTEYLQGNLPLISSTEIEQNYQQDLSRYIGAIPQYHFDKSQHIIQKMNGGAFTPAEKIFVQIGYTNGAQYPGRKDYDFHVSSPGKIKLQYSANFEMPEYGQANFVVEESSSGSNIIFDSTIKSNNASGFIEINITAPGDYTLAVSTKFKTDLHLEINTGGFIFFKNGAFLGDVRENFSAKPSSFPGSFYVPSGISRVYFGLTNSYNSNSGYLSVAEVDKIFIFKDNYGKIVSPKQVAGDSLLFYLDIPFSQSGSFWQFFNTANRFTLCFSNISNFYWFGKPKNCNDSDFEIDIVKQGDQCLVRLTAKKFTGTNEWQIFDKNKLSLYTNKKEIILPAGTSPYAVISHRESTNCSTQKSLWDIQDYGQMLENCANGASLPSNYKPLSIIAFPNPSTGRFQFKKDNELVWIADINIYDSKGQKVFRRLNTNVLDISQLPSANYFYLLKTGELEYRGKIQKH